MLAVVRSDIFDRSPNVMEDVLELDDADVDTGSCKSADNEVTVNSSFNDCVRGLMPIGIRDGRVWLVINDGRVLLVVERRMLLRSRHSFAKVTAVGTDDTQDCDAIVRSDGSVLIGRVNDAADRSEVRDLVRNKESGYPFPIRYRSVFPSLCPLIELDRSHSGRYPCE